MAKANLLIEFMSLATSIAMLAPNAGLLPSAECYAPHRWWWFKKAQQQNNQKQTPKNPKKPFLEFFKNHLYGILGVCRPKCWRSLWLKAPTFPTELAIPKARRALTQMLFQASAGKDVVVIPSWPALSPVPPSVAQPRQPCRLRTVHRTGLA